MVFVVIGEAVAPPWLRHCQLAEQQRHLGCEQQAFEYMTSFAVLSASCVQTSSKILIKPFQNTVCLIYFLP
jgi:hypothetical protein